MTSKRRKLSTPQRIALAVLAVVVVASLAVPAALRAARVDACLDSGGHVGAGGRCEH